ncbi:protein PALS2-like [Watersipora subatra]|uniref:protein PALS2-like n=1 Tax=Watersipora subatra TaxID=2589382 RepID=UPI00355B0898
MPGASETAHEALVRVCNEIDQSDKGGTVDEYAFVRAILQDVVVDAMFQTHEKSGEPMQPADHNASGTVNDLLDLLDQDPSMNEPETHELFDLLADADMQGVLMAHDDIAKKSFVPVKYTKKAEVYQPPVVPSHQEPNMHAHTDDRSKLVIVNKSSTEPLGITVSNDDAGNEGELVVTRIHPGSIADRQDLIHVGDVILEVNNVSVNTPEDVGEVISRSGPEIRFLVLPESERIVNGTDNKRYLKTHFAYSPQKDSRRSEPSMGLAFEEDDILVILKDKDKNWWECRNLRTNCTGDVPSPSYEEKRKHMMSQPPPDKTKSSLLCGLGKSKKKKPVSNIPTKPDQSPSVLYEEVIHVKSFRHKCLVLVGAQGIGRRSIKNLLIQFRPQDFGAPTPNTSRPMREGEVPGRNYHFLKREDMDRDIKEAKYLEYGELNNNYYGTSLAALKNVIDSGKTCIVDPKAGALAKLRTVEWLPFVVFIKPTNAESLKNMNQQALDDGVDTQRKSDDEIRRILEETQRIYRQFIHLCDTSIPYDNFETACKMILQLLDTADSTPQFVPSSWASVTERIPV